MFMQVAKRWDSILRSVVCRILIRIQARVSLARAAYSDSDVILLDDPLSAVDSYVGKAILEQCILKGPLANRTRILVTHALHVLDKTDYIYVMDNGVITEEGTFDSLMQKSVVFSRLMDDYGSLEVEKDSKEPKKGGKVKGDAVAGDEVDLGKDKQKDPALMQEEERNTGAVSWDTYGKYLRFGGGIVWAPFIILMLTLMQGAQGLSTITSHRCSRNTDRWN